MRTALAPILFTALLTLIGGSIVYSQESSLEQVAPEGEASDADRRPSDTAFFEVMLTEDGVVATDTSGNEWYYDFETDLFVLGVRQTADGQRQPIEPGYEGLDLPIEERASERRRVKPFEQRSITIGYDEYVDGNVVAYGRVTVKGWVKGDVRSLTRVVVTATGVVDGKVMAPDIDLRDGGIAKSGIQETSAPIDLRDITDPFSGSFLKTIAILSGIILIVTFLSSSLMPRQLNNICLACRHYPVRSSLLGFLLLFLLPLVVTLVVVTIVGALIVWVVPIVYVFALLLGIVAAGDRIGSRILRWLGRTVSSSWVRSLTGVLVICIVWGIVAIMTGFDNAFFDVVGIIILILVSAYTLFAMLNGLGAVLLTRFGTRPYISWRDRQAQDTDAPSPAPPPRPSAPPVTPPSRSEPPASGPLPPAPEPPKAPSARAETKDSPEPKQPESTGSDAPPVSPPPGKRSDSDAT